jgi:hypothetical protein
MKNIFILLMAVSLTMIACQKTPVVQNGSPEFATASGPGNGGNNNQNATVPQAVLQSFASHFGSVAVRQWKLRSDGNWRAHFTWTGVAWEATFTPAGILVKSEPA